MRQIAATMSDRPQISPGERFADADEWDHQRAQPPHIWATLGYRRISWEPGQTEIAWTATEDYCFPTAGGPIVQGGLVTALLDAAGERLHHRAGAEACA